MVITLITRGRKLHRLYLDREAVGRFVGGRPEEIQKTIKAKGIDHKEMPPINGIRQGLTECERMVSENGWMLFSLYPMQISVQTVNYCNARCDFCYANAPSVSDRKAMDTKTLYNLKDYAASRGVKFGVSGGEPLLHPKIYDLLEYRNDEVFDTLITNLTPGFEAKRLIKTDVDLVQVSLHGYGRSHDEALGIAGAYDKVRSRMIELMPHLNIATNTVITPKNITAAEKLVRDLARIQEDIGKKFTYVRFVPVMPSGRGYKKYTESGKFMEDVKSLLTGLKRKYTELEFELPLLHPNPYEYFSDRGRWACPAGCTVCVVRVDGRVMPCNQFLGTDVGSGAHVGEREFHEIWTHDPLLSKMRMGNGSERAGQSTSSCENCAYLKMKGLRELNPRDPGA